MKSEEGSRDFREWYYKDNQYRPYGPFSVEELKTLLSAGSIDVHTPVKGANMTGYLSLKNSHIYTYLTETSTAPIFNAAEAGDLEKVQALLKDYLDLVFTEDKYGQTPLHIAAENGHRDMAELLLNNGADVNAKANNYTRPLHIAAENGHRDMAELLLNNGADVNAKANGDNTPLHFVVKKANRDMAEYFNNGDVCKAWNNILHCRKRQHG